MSDLFFFSDEVKIHNNFISLFLTEHVRIILFNVTTHHLASYNVIIKSGDITKLNKNAMIWVNGHQLVNSLADVTFL